MEESVPNELFRPWTAMETQYKIPSDYGVSLKGIIQEALTECRNDSQVVVVTTPDEEEPDEEVAKVVPVGTLGELWSYERGAPVTYQEGCYEDVDEMDDTTDCMECKIIEVDEDDD